MSRWNELESLQEFNDYCENNNLKIKANPIGDVNCEVLSPNFNGITLAIETLKYNRDNVIKIIKNKL